MSAVAELPKQSLLARIDLDRCRRAMKRVSVHGLCNTPQRQKAIADAIAAIQQSPTLALVKEYIGIKNYAGFGDQREDHGYGYGPRHGSIVFSVRRHSEGALGADEIYLIECCRDFPGIKRTWESDYEKQKWTADLCTCIQIMDREQSIVALIAAKLSDFMPDTHDFSAESSPKA